MAPSLNTHWLTVIDDRIEKLNLASLAHLPAAVDTRVVVWAAVADTEEVTVAVQHAKFSSTTSVPSFRPIRA